MSTGIAFIFGLDWELIVRGFAGLVLVLLFVAAVIALKTED